MMKYFAITALLAISATAVAYHSHYYTKISEAKDSMGNTVCTWQCGYGSERHFETTSGIAYCPNP